MHLIVSAVRAGSAALVLLTVLVCGLNAQVAPDPAAQKAKAKIEKIGRGGDLTVKTTAGREFYGSIKDLGPEFVTIQEVDLRQDIEVRYSEIKSVNKGYGQTRAWNGTRIPPKKHFIGIAIATGVLAAVLIGVVVGGKD